MAATALLPAVPLQLPLLLSLLLLPLPLCRYAADRCAAALMHRCKCCHRCSPSEPLGAAPALLLLHRSPLSTAAIAAVAAAATAAALLALSPLINLGTQHDGRSARTWMKRV